MSVWGEYVEMMLPVDGNGAARAMSKLPSPQERAWSSSPRDNVLGTADSIGESSGPEAQDVQQADPTSVCDIGLRSRGFAGRGSASSPWSRLRGGSTRRWDD